MLYGKNCVTCTYGDKNFVTNDIFAIIEPLAQLNADMKLKLIEWNEKHDTKPKLDSIIKPLEEYKHVIKDSKLVDLSDIIPESIYEDEDSLLTVRLNPYYMNYIEKCLQSTTYTILTDITCRDVVFTSNNGELLAVIKPIEQR